MKGDDRVRIAVYIYLPMRYGWGRTLPPLPARLDDAVLDGLLAPHTRRAVLAAAQLAFYVQILI